MSRIKITFEINEKQQERLTFLFDTFDDGRTNYNDAKEKIMNEALHKYYKEVVGNINQGNEHDGLPLIKEIYD